MGFSVDVAALAGLPRLLDRLDEDAQAGRAYAERHTRLDAGEGIFNLVLGGHRRATAQVEAFFTTLGTAAGMQSDRVQYAIDGYRRTDHATAAKFDATFPATPSAPWLQPDPVGSTGFRDRSEPQNLLKAPADYSADYSFEMKWHSYLSPTSYLRMLIWEVTSLASRLGICSRPIDVFVEWLKPWLGDWAGFRACADVHDRLGKSTVVMSANVRSGTIDSQFAWTGNAADSSRHDLGDTGAALEQAQPKLADLSAEYKSVAESTYKLAESVAGLVVVAIDLAVMALLELQLAVATSETIVGGVIFGGAAAATIWKIIEIGGKIYDCIKLAEYGANAFSSGMDGFSVIDSKGPLPTLTLGETARPGPSTTEWVPA
jgi:hypothetical protein